MPKLTIENVKIVNENGESIGEGDILENSKELALEQLHYKQNFENILENKIVNILAPIVGGKTRWSQGSMRSLISAKRKAPKRLLIPIMS